MLHKQTWHNSYVNWRLSGPGRRPSQPAVPGFEVNPASSPVASSPTGASELDQPVLTSVGGVVVDVKKTPRPWAARSKTMVFSGAAALVLGTVMFQLPVPYILETPGLAVDTLGAQDGVELVQVDAPARQPATGKLLLTTVGAFGSEPGSLSLVQMIAGYFNSADALIPYDLVYPRGQTSEQREQESADQMVSSQENSTVAALEYLGYTVPPLVEVVWEDGPSVGLLEVGDLLVSIDGEPVKGYSHLIGMLDQLIPGQEVTVGYERSGTQGQALVATTDAAGRARLGLSVSVDPPVKVEFGVEDIGGPSAGLMFALAIIDKLGEVDLTGGLVVAGTGTIDANGEIGAIGGIRQKMIGASREHATVFLAPADNCDEVIGNVPANLQVIKVTRLDDAVNALIAIGQNPAAQVPTCLG